MTGKMMEGYRQILLAAAVSAALLAADCAPRPKADAPNVLLLSIDTLRADHLGCYGYERETSPILDALAAEGLRFEQAFAPAPWTLPSHAAMLTGVHPFDMMMRHKSSAIPDRAPRLARTLERAGYRTAAFVDSSKGGYVGERRGFGEGFGEFHHAPHGEKSFYKYDMAATADAAIGWLEGHRAEGSGRPFFLFLHTKSVHAVPPKTPCRDERCFPYDKPEPYRFRFVADEGARFPWKDEQMGWGQEFLWSLNRSFLDGSRDPREFPEHEVEVLRGLYDAGIYYTDQHFGRILERLRELGLDEKTLVVVTSDHGEAFLEHNLLMHQEVYPEALRVPLIFRPPARPSSEVPAAPPRRHIPLSSPVTLMDVAPTILDLLGLEVLESMTGRSLLSGEPDAASAQLSYYLFPPTFTYRAFSLRTPDRTLVHHNFQDVGRSDSELYDRVADPRLLHPLTGREEERRDLLAQLRERLRRRPLFAPKLIKEDEEALRQLQSVGYID